MSRVLLIEDNDDDIALTQHVFKGMGVEKDLHIIRDGAEALDYLLGHDAYAGQGSPSTIRLILLDLGLPKVSGLDVLGQLRLDSRTTNIPVVVMTISKKERDLIQSFTMGISDYLIKPIQPERFVPMYRHYVEDVKA